MTIRIYTEYLNLSLKYKESHISLIVYNGRTSGVRIPVGLQQLIQVNISVMSPYNHSNQFLATPHLLRHQCFYDTYILDSSFTLPHNLQFPPWNPPPRSTISLFKSAFYSFWQRRMLIKPFHHLASSTQRLGNDDHIR